VYKLNTENKICQDWKLRHLSTLRAKLSQCSVWLHIGRSEFDPRQRQMMFSLASESRPTPRPAHPNIQRVRRPFPGSKKQPKCDADHELAELVCNKNPHWKEPSLKSLICYSRNKIKTFVKIVCKYVTFHLYGTAHWSRHSCPNRKLCWSRMELERGKNESSLLEVRLRSCMSSLAEMKLIKICDYKVI
jgi:hypothetical protein